MAGKLIVIEGTDAVGKATQSKLLAEKLGSIGGQNAEIINFPTYGSEFGKLIKDYLQGGLGGRDALSPEAVSLLYALDRYQYLGKLEKMLTSGKYIICNRYSQSNLYQAAKIANKAEREKFIGWFNSVEGRLPFADAVIFLNLPVAVSRKLLISRGEKIDIHERDICYQEEVRSLYLREAIRGKWIVINCAQNGTLKTKGKISQEIFAALKKKLKI
ncbi:MAG: thymidylate kinase [Candidatus Micrarchaeota archaeon]